MWRGRIRLGVLLLGIVTAGTADYGSFAGVWALDSARSDFGQCRDVKIVALRVDYTVPRRVSVIELANDQLAAHLIKREFVALRRAGNTMQLQTEQQSNSAAFEEWTLRSDGSQLSIRRMCGQSLQRLVFQRSITIPD